jgi:hypothetical protein
MALFMQLSTLGPLLIAHTKLDIADARSRLTDLTLGLDFMRQTHVRVSNSSRSVAIQVPATPTPHIDAARAP